MQMDFFTFGEIAMKVKLEIILHRIKIFPKKFSKVNIPGQLILGMIQVTKLLQSLLETHKALH